jgi:hypothetical protein
VAALTVMLPYMCVKHEQAELAILYHTTKAAMSWEQKLECAEQMKALKKIKDVLA